jgi:hypothetical protein
MIDLTEDLNKNINNFKKDNKKSLKIETKIEDFADKWEIVPSKKRTVISCGGIDICSINS